MVRDAHDLAQGQAFALDTLLREDQAPQARRCAHAEPTFTPVTMETRATAIGATLEVEVR